MSTNNNEQTNEEQKKVAIGHELVLAKVPEDNRVVIAKYLGEQNLENLASVKSKLASFKRRFKADNFKVSGPTDKEGIEKLAEARKEMRLFRTNLENERVATVELANAFIKTVNPLYNDPISEIETLEAPLKKMDRDVKEMQKNEEIRLAKEEAQRVIDRVDILTKAGIAFNGDYYVAGDAKLEIEEVSIGQVDLKTMDKKGFLDFLEKAKELNDAVNLKKEEIRLQQEKEKQELEKGQQLLAEQQKQLNEQLAQQKKEKIDNRSEQLLGIEMEYDEKNKIFKLDSFVLPLDTIAEMPSPDWIKMVGDIKLSIKEKKEKKAAEDALQLKKDTRHSEVVSIGFTPEQKYLSYQYRHYVALFTDIASYDIPQWNERISELKKEVLKADSEIKINEERAAEISPFLLFGHTVNISALYLLSEEQYKQLLEDSKLKHQEKINNDIKVQNELKQKQEAEALKKSSDESKWKTLLDYLCNAPVVEMESDGFKLKYSRFLTLIEQIKTIK